MPAKITLTPATAAPGAAETAALTGFGWAWWIDVTLDGTKVARVKASTSGKATATFTAPTTPGPHIVKAKSAYRSATATLTVTGAADAPPVISGIAVTAITQTGFTVSWLASEPAQGWIEYGLTTAYGTETPHETSLNFSAHAQTITGLQAGTTYHFRVHAVDAAGQHVTSADQVMLTSGVIVPPTGRPWPAPVTSRTITVPANVTDLSAFIATVADGSIIECPATGSYSVVKLEGRNHLDIRGNGATIRQTGSASQQNSTALLVRACTHIRFDNFKVTGNNPNTTTIFGGGEDSHAFSTGGWYGLGPSSYIEVTRVNARNLYGDFAYLEGRNLAPREPSHHVWIHDNDGTYIGRNAISSININDLLVEANRFDKIGMDVWDIEPNFAGEQIKRNTLTRNTIGSYSHMTQFVGWLLSNWNVPKACPVEDIEVSHNTVVGIAVSGKDRTPRGLNTKSDVPFTKRVTIIGNSTAQPAIGPVIYLNGVAGVTLYGNVQPLVSGALDATPGCTDVKRTP